MSFTYAKETAGAVWASTVIATGLIGHFASVTDWIVLSALAVVPLVIGYRLWREPAQTMSETIRSARR